MKLLLIRSQDIKWTSEALCCIAYEFPWEASYPALTLVPNFRTLFALLLQQGDIDVRFFILQVSRNQRAMWPEFHPYLLGKNYELVNRSPIFYFFGEGMQGNLSQNKNGCDRFWIVTQTGATWAIPNIFEGSAVSCFILWCRFILAAQNLVDTAHFVWLLVMSQLPKCSFWMYVGPINKQQTGCFKISAKNIFLPTI